MIIRTDAVVLRRLHYGETSQIVTLFTREKGKLAVMAKGARRPKSRFGASLEPATYAQVVFYYKPTRSLQTLSESALAEPLLGVPRRLDKIGAALRIVELVDALVQDEDPQPRLFNLLVEVLRRLSRAEVRVGNVLPYFQLRLAGVLGFRPAVERAAVEALPGRGGLLDLGSGAMRRPEHAPEEALRASRSALRAFAVLARADLDAVMRMTLRPPVRREVEALVEAYLRHHMADAYPTRSRAVLRSLQVGLSGADKGRAQEGG